MTTAVLPATGVRGYADDLEHLADELRRLDLRIRLRAAELRARLHPESQLDRPVYISDEEVDRLLRSDEGPVVRALDGGAGPSAPAQRSALAELSARIDGRVRRSTADGVPLRLPRLRRAFALSDLDVQTVLVCLAPELRRKYDRLYAYLQDDITRQRPSVDLVLELLCPDEAERWRARARFAEGAPLRRSGLLEVVADPASPSGSSGLARFLRLDPRILGFLLGDDALDARLDGRARLYPPASDQDAPDVLPDVLTRLQAMVEARLRDPGGRPAVVHLHGPAGAGKQTLARYVCGRLGVGLLAVDVDAVVAEPADEAVALLRLALREGLLQDAVVYLGGVDPLQEASGRPVVRALADTLAECRRMVISAGRTPWYDAADDPGLVSPVEVPETPAPVRAAVWRRELAGRTPRARDWAGDLATRYRLTPGRIRAAVLAAAEEATIRGEGPALTLDDLTRACRRQSSHRVAELASTVEPCYGWDDLVLPDDRTTLLREICDQVRHHQRVYEDWGFRRRLGHGTSLSVLFSGPPGTGKTMAAQVLAGDLGLDLYRIDLSRVVSKYIGETEKNLARVFAEAETSNAILFFDEADALFGKRTEVADAHDRYANIETSYLLQRMEDYAGVVVLATNLRQNLDDAFARRIRFLVDFPFPDERSRQLMWRKHLPPDAPVAPDVDWELLARSFPVTGGSIKNIVLNAAFLAAADGGPIRPQHLLQGTRREFDKVGKVWSDPR
ncbi:AAA family ATPase [Geodermatophilus sp. CPCC 205506]|uniref:AAA family ATPase n=1 Tax=Geodermatophilus sp. CPCC 205506 TaxID=2936596 RepID=UPI003EEA3659